MIQRYEDLEWRGKHIRLCLTMDVLLNIQEEYQCTFSNLFEGTDREVYEREQAFLVMMSYEGQAITDTDEKIDALTYTDFKGLQPFEREKLREAMWKAAAKGFRKEYEEDEIDEGLLEIKKKKTSILQKARRLIRRERLE